QAPEVLERRVDGHEPGRRGEDLRRRLEGGRQHPEQRKRAHGQQHERARVEREGAAAHENASSPRKSRKYTSGAAMSIRNMIRARVAPMPACRYVKLRA